MFTVGMGILILESVIFTYGWMSAYLALVTGGFIIFSNFKKIKKKYYIFIIHRHPVTIPVTVFSILTKNVVSCYIYFLF